MYGDFYFPSFFYSFSSNLPIYSHFPYFQRYLNSQIPATPHFQREPQSYTTKQNPLKIDTQTTQKQSNQLSKDKNELISAKNRRKKQNKSIFHNYQKHLVTTLKQKITIDQIKQFDSEDLCLKELWYGFNKAKIANRTLLLAVFGEQKSQNSQVIRHLQKCKLSGILNKFKVAQIKESQRKIRKIVKEYFSDKNLDMELAARKLPEEEKPVFKHYVNYFLTELAQGTLNRRLPKRYKRQMML